MPPRLSHFALTVAAALGLAPPAASSAKDLPAAQAGGTLEASAAWKRLRALVTDAEEIDAGRRGLYPFSPSERDRLWNRFAEAPKDLEALVAARLLDRDEAEVYAQWLTAVRDRLGRFRTNDMQQATCYKPMPPPYRAEVSDRSAAQAAVNQLQARLPLVRRLLDAQTVHPDVVRKALELVARDRDALLQNPHLTREQKKALDEVSAAIAALQDRL